MALHFLVVLLQSLNMVKDSRKLRVSRSTCLFVLVYFTLLLACCHLFRHEMQHFVHNLEGYLSNQILNVTWSEFQEGLLNVSAWTESDKWNFLKIKGNLELTANVKINWALVKPVTVITDMLFLTATCPSRIHPVTVTYPSRRGFGGIFIILSKIQRGL